MRRAVWIMLALFLLTGSASAARFLGGPPRPGEAPSRFVRVEGLALGGLYESRDDVGAISGRLGTVTCVLGRLRVGVTPLDGFGRPKSMNEGHSLIELLFPVNVGCNLVSDPPESWRMFGAAPEIYTEAVLGFWNHADAQYKPRPNARLALCCGLAGHGVGTRTQLGYLVGRDAFFAGLEVRLGTFDRGF